MCDSPIDTTLCVEIWGICLFVFNFLFCFILFEAGSTYIAQAGFNSWQPSRLSCPSAGMTDAPPCGRLGFLLLLCFDSGPGELIPAGREFQQAEKSSNV